MIGSARFVRNSASSGMSAGNITVHSPSAYQHLRLDGSVEGKAEKTGVCRPHVTLVRSIFSYYSLHYRITYILSAIIMLDEMYDYKIVIFNNSYYDQYFEYVSLEDYYSPFFPLHVRFPPSQA